MCYGVVKEQKLMKKQEKKGVMSRVSKRLGLMFLCIGMFLLIPVQLLSAAAVDTQTFSQFLESFYAEAARKGISRSTYDRVFEGVTEPDAKVLKSAAYQPEFTTEIWDYLDARVTRGAVTNGMILSAVYKQVLHDIEARFGVESSVVLAIWSMETSYGAALLRKHRLHYVPRALATLAYADKRRRKFARSQLLAILEMVQSGDVSPEQLTGSWAGAMGHTQFIPTSFLAYGVDMDGNGHRDIWASVPDALATAANLLHSNKWRTGKRWGYEVKVPAGGEQFAGETKTLARWQKLGFVRPRGESFADPEEKAELKLLGGNAGPGFLVLRNFFVIKRYNNSDFYALAVGLLSDRLAGRSGMQQLWPRPAGALSADEKIELQERLIERGYYSGKVDGQIGTNTRKAIRKFQKEQGLAADGVANVDLLKVLRR